MNSIRPIKSITKMNTLHRKRGMGGQPRLDEIREANIEQTKQFACHHVSRALDHTLDHQVKVAELSDFDLKALGKTGREDFARSIFWGFACMHRLEPGMAAIQKLAGGYLPPAIEEQWQRIVKILQRADGIQQKYYATPRAQRNPEKLYAEMEPLFDELTQRILDFYGSAKSRYDLPELNDGGAQ